MATIITSIGKAVGVRNGLNWMPNKKEDLNRIKDLFDRIPVASAGTAGLNMKWPVDQNLLVLQLTGLITTFQTAHRRPSIDGVVDPGGGTLRLMNQLAAEPNVSAVVVQPPGALKTEIADDYLVAATDSVPGRRQLRKAWVETKYSRRLVEVTGSSIKWFGVVVPDAVNVGHVPHVNFTPSPYQGGYMDPGYSSFITWAKLWDDYTTKMGGMMAAATDQQILIIPFYTNVQHGTGLGTFRNNWYDVICAVATAAINSVDVLLLRSTYTFEKLVSSSFSNGWIPHRNFNSAPGVSAATLVAFDIDGEASRPTSHNWRPMNNVKYKNRPVPGNSPNPAGRDFYVGGRWDDMAHPEPALYTHHMCSLHLLYHGIRTFCR